MPSALRRDYGAPYLGKDHGSRCSDEQHLASELHLYGPDTGCVIEFLKAILTEPTEKSLVHLRKIHVFDTKSTAAINPITAPAKNVGIAGGC